MMRLSRLILLGVLLSSVAYGQALTIGGYYSDNMVLQRDKANVIRGSAMPGAEVKVSFAGQGKTGKADAAGVWAVTLDPLAASGKEMELSVTSGSDTVVVKNVVVGDVILFGRQTSIDLSLGRDDEGRKAASGANQGFRSMVIHTVPAAEPRSDLDGKSTTGWRVVGKDQALTMTAAAFHLGSDLAKETDVPVGIVDLNMGWHFPIAWLPREATLAAAKTRVQQMEAERAAYVSGEPYGKKKEIIKVDPVEHPLYPAAGYNAVIHPLKGIAFKGVIIQLGNDYPYVYYEKLKAEGKMTDRGLLNHAYVETYDIRKEGFRMEPAMLNPLPGEWRTAFGDAALPLAFIHPPASDLSTYAAHNREMRELQRKIAEREEAIGIILPGMESIPFSGQPKDESLLAERSLKWALGTLYGKGVATGPLYARMDAEGTKATVYFKEGTATGLKAGKDALATFEVADVDARYVPAKAVIDGETIKLSSDDLSRIFHVRYNWNENPDQGLVNSVGLPAVPFRTEVSDHAWFVTHKDDDLPAEYFTPANEWKSGSVTLINSQLEGIGYPHFSGWLGPIGVHTGPFGPNMGVRTVRQGSPAEGKLFVGDVIYSANGKMLGDEEEMTMAAAITESEATAGRLLLGVHRDGANLDVELQLRVLGRYSATSPWNCLKSEKIVKNLEAWVAAQGGGDGYLYTDAMFLLGAGSPEYQWLVRMNAARHFSGGTPGNNWSLGYLTIYLSEYYLATGDKRVLPRIQQLCEAIAAMQIQEDGGRHGGWYARGNEPRGYPEMAHAGVSCMLALTLARECGVAVDPGTFQRGLDFLERKGAPVGIIIYGDAYRSEPPAINPDSMLAGKLSTDNGKVPEAAVLYNLLGDRRAAHLNSLISTHGWYSTRDGHGGNFWNDFWTPLGAAVHSQDAYIYFMRNHRWYRECHRMFDGGLLQQDTVAAGAGLALVVPARRMRILGAPKSPFSPGAPDVLKPALAAYEARDYQQAQALCMALLSDKNLDKSSVPTISKLADEAKRMQDGMAADLARITGLGTAGRLHEAGLMLASLKPIMTEDDARLAAVTEQLANCKARPDDASLYAAALKGGGGQDGGQAEAQSADDLMKMQEAKKAAAEAAAAAAREWECLTPREFIGQGKPSDEARPADTAAKWRIMVLETRDKAPDGWEKPGFDDSRWNETTHPISWHLNHTALHRTTFHVKDKSTYDLLKFKSYVFRQQDVAIYLNGVLIGRINNIEGKTSEIGNEFKPVAVKHLKDGENTLAIATRQNWRWGMLFPHVYNDGFDFRLFASRVKPAGMEK